MTSERKPFPKKPVMTFRNLTACAREHTLVLAECEDVRTGKKAYVVCEQFSDHGSVRYTPIARLFDGNPYNDITPPGCSAPKMI